MTEKLYDKQRVAECYYPNLFPAKAWVNFVGAVCKDKILMPHIFGNKEMINQKYLTESQLKWLRKRLGKPKLKIFPAV